MAFPTRPDSAPAPHLAPVAWGLAGLALAAHLIVALVTPYGLHRDEFLYLSLGKHLRFWTMDVPPGIGLFANAARAIFGDTVFAVRFFPAFATLLVLLIAFGAITLPFGVPVVPPAPMARYASALGLTQTTNQGEVLPLPQDYADMLGWEEQVQAVARAYEALPPADRAQAILLAGNYGEAGALDFYGPRYGLPRVVCAHTSFWYFGPGDKPGLIAVGIGLTPEDLESFYREVTVVARVSGRWAVPEEVNVPVVVARRPNRPVQEVWPLLAGQY